MSIQRSASLKVCRLVTLMFLIAMLMSAVTFAGDTELINTEQISTNTESTLTVPVEPSEQLVPVQDTGENLMAGIENNAPQCQYETCDFSVECWESCESAHPACPENGDNFCWCIRACADICV